MKVFHRGIFCRSPDGFSAAFPGYLHFAYRELHSQSIKLSTLPLESRKSALVVRQPLFSNNNPLFIRGTFLTRYHLFKEGGGFIPDGFNGRPKMTSLNWDESKFAKFYFRILNEWKLPFINHNFELRLKNHQFRKFFYKLFFSNFYIILHMNKYYN